RGGGHRRSWRVEILPLLVHSVLVRVRAVVILREQRGRGLSTGRMTVLGLSGALVHWSLARGDRRASLHNVHHIGLAACAVSRLSLNRGVRQLAPRHSDAVLGLIELQLLVPIVGQLAYL